MIASALSSIACVSQGNLQHVPFPLHATIDMNTAKRSLSPSHQTSHDLAAVAPKRTRKEDTGTTFHPEARETHEPADKPQDHPKLPTIRLTMAKTDGSASTPKSVIATVKPPQDPPDESRLPEVDALTDPATGKRKRLPSRETIQKMHYDKDQVDMLVRIVENAKQHKRSGDILVVNDARLLKTPEHPVYLGIFLLVFLMRDRACGVHGSAVQDAAFQPCC